MELIKEHSSLLPAFPRFFDDFILKGSFDGEHQYFSMAGSSLPAVNILETRDDFIIEMATPGLKKRDFKIELKNCGAGGDRKRRLRCAVLNFT